MTRSQPEASVTDATEVAGGVIVPGGEIEAVRKRIPKPKWRIACINWSHKDAPHAAAYYIDGERLHDHYFATWTDAVAWVDLITRKP